MDAINRLRESTKKLLCLVEEIQSKTHTNTNVLDDVPNVTNLINTISHSQGQDLRPDIIDNVALKKLQNQAKYLDSITIEGEDDNCSVYKRLTRKCHCLNRREYNDFIIHFNEETRYCMSTLGEIVKNIRILKKFLYMGGDYTRNALLLLNEGLVTSAHKEKVDIIMACSHADVCNVFDESSIVTVCISWPFKLPNFGDCLTQSSAAGILYKLAQVEEGRRYLNFSTKITNDIKKVLKTHTYKLEQITLECLNNTLSLLSPTLARNMNVTYYCKAEEGVGNKTLHALENCRHYMTLEEIFTHIELLQQMTNNENTRRELTQYLPRLLCLFKHLLIDYDNSDMNVILIDILSNIVTKPTKFETEPPKTFIVTDIATEPIYTRHAFNQVPSRRALRTFNQSKSTNKELRKVGGMMWSTKLPNKPKTSYKDIAPITSRTPYIIISPE